MLDKSVSNTKLSHGKSVESNDGATLFYDLLTLFLLLFRYFFLSLTLSCLHSLSLYSSLNRFNLEKKIAWTKVHPKHRSYAISFVINEMFAGVFAAAL